MAVFETPARVLTGRGCFDQLGAEAARLGKRCLVVTGSEAMRKQGILDLALGFLRDSGVAAAVFTGVESDPEAETVDQVRARLRAEKCDFVLGLGGGSAIDAAKAAACLCAADAPTEEFLLGRQKPPAGALPIAAAPCTFGTGAEATRVAVLSCRRLKIKRGMRHDAMLPRLALVDPVLGAGAPPRLSAACGMDAITQAIESYLSRHATDLTRSLSFSALLLLKTGLERSCADGLDMEARECCANGSLMAGLALHNARLGLVHGIAHPLGLLRGVPHGEACGTLLPAVLHYNRAAAGEHYAALSGGVGCDVAEFCKELLRQLGLPTDFRSLNLAPAEIEFIADETMPSGSTQANPRKVERGEVVELLRGLCG